jgi:dihydrofolate reductase
MSRVVVIHHLTLDGVMQAPGRPEEDTRGGFELGGWAGPNVDGLVNAAMGARMPRSGGLLLGRRSYEVLRVPQAGRDKALLVREVVQTRHRAPVSLTQKRLHIFRSIRTIWPNEIQARSEALAEGAFIEALAEQGPVYSA